MIHYKNSLPEGFNYVDTGCELAPSCLNCPFEICKHDLKSHHEKQRQKRDSTILEMLTVGLSTAYISRELEVSTRTIFRIKSKGVK